MTIGDNIKRLLEERGMSQNELSRRTGISKANVSLMVNGRRNDIKLHTLRSLCEALGCKAEDLMKGVGDEG